MRKTILFAIVFLFSIFLAGCVAATSTQNFPPWTDLQAVLVWLSDLGAPFIIGMAVSYLAANAKWWVDLSGTIKFWIALIASVALSLLATYLLAIPDLIAFVQPYWSIAIKAVLAYLGTQVAYANILRSRYGVAFKAERKQSCC